MNKVYQDSCVVIYCGHVTDVLSAMPPCSVQIVMTSPPYLWTRDYQITEQWGQEGSWQEWIAHIEELGSALHRVLHIDGSFWLNLDDRIANQRTHEHGGKSDPVSCTMNVMMMPERAAIALINQEWILRNKIIWYKPDAMADFVGRGRFTRTYEMLYWFVKSKRYKFNLDAIRTESRTMEMPDLTRERVSKAVGLVQHPLFNVSPDDPSDFVNAPPWGTPEYEEWYHNVRKKTGFHDHKSDEIQGRRYDLPSALKHPRGAVTGDVWSISSSSKLRGRHTSVFPEQLCAIPIVATTDPGDIVLDPFCGSATVGVVAKRMGRRAILIDIDMQSCKEAANRIQKIPIPMEIILEERSKP